MNKELQNIISRYTEQQLCLDSIVVSSFVKNNALIVRGGLLANYYRNDVPSVGIKSIEDVINVFELAIPKEEKTKNGAVYTPKYIRDYILERVVATHRNHCKTVLQSILLAVAAHSYFHLPTICTPIANCHIVKQYIVFTVWT